MTLGEYASLPMNPIAHNMYSYLSLIKKVEINHDELHRGVEIFYMSMSYIDLEKVSKASEQVLGCAIFAQMFRLLEVYLTKINHIKYQRNQKSEC